MFVLYVHYMYSVCTVYVQCMYIDQQYKRPVQRPKVSVFMVVLYHWTLFSTHKNKNKTLFARCYTLDNIIQYHQTNDNICFILFCSQRCVAHQIPTSFSPSHSCLDSIKFHRLNLKVRGQQQVFMFTFSLLSPSFHTESFLSSFALSLFHGLFSDGDMEQMQTGANIISSTHIYADDAQFYMPVNCGYTTETNAFELRVLK